MASYKFATVKAKDLHTDYSYQRPLQLAWLKHIKDKFDSSQVRELVLSERQDGSLWVLDGNHTATAAKERYGDDVELRAKIYSGLTVEEEAKLFEQLNSNSKKVEFNDKLRARVAQQDAEALDYVDALESSGIEWGYKGGGRHGRYVAHSAGISILKRYGKESLIKSLMILKASNDKELYTGQICGGICHLISTTNINHDELIRTLKKYSKAEIEKKRRLFGDGSNDATVPTNILYAKGILELYNFGKRKNKIKLKEYA